MMKCFFTNCVRFIVAALALLTLNACTQTSSGPWNGSVGNNSSTAPQTQQNNYQNQKPVEVALLVPLSGKGAQLGQAILNASQLALFDMNPQNFQLIPKDTKGNPVDAQIAAQEAINHGADLVLGPLFSDSVKSVATASANYNINVLGFTTDSTAASHNGFAMGFLPSTQVEQIIDYATHQQKQRFTVVVPNNQYGALVSKTAREMLSQSGYSAPHIHTITTQPDVNRLYSDTVANQSQAILLAVDLNTASSISNHLIANGLPNARLQRLGLGLWDDRQRSYSSALEGAWYASPDPNKRDRFVRLYKNTYGTTPPRLASIGYDATALAISLAKSGDDYTKNSLTRPNGFYGLDGIFRFKQDGLVQRKLSILEFSRGRTMVRVQPSKNF